MKDIFGNDIMNVPRNEYEELVRDSERLAIVVKLHSVMDSYDLKKVLDVLFNEPVTEMDA